VKLIESIKSKFLNKAKVKITTRIIDHGGEYPHIRCCLCGKINPQATQIEVKPPIPVCIFAKILRQSIIKNTFSGYNMDGGWYGVICKKCLNEIKVHYEVS